MVDYTVEWVNGEYVRVPKRRASRVVTLDAAVIRGSNWRVWCRPRRGGASELYGDRTQIGVIR